MNKKVLKHLTVLTALIFMVVLFSVLSSSLFFAETPITWGEILDSKILGYTLILLQILAAVFLFIFVVYLIILATRSKKKNKKQVEEPKKEEDKVENQKVYIVNNKQENEEEIKKSEEVKQIEEPKKEEDKVENKQETYSYVENIYNNEEKIIEQEDKKQIEEPKKEEDKVENKIEYIDSDQQEEIDNALFESFDEDSIDDSEFDDDDDEDLLIESNIVTGNENIVSEEENKTIKAESVKRTFLNKMSTQPNEIKSFYSELRNEFLSYKDVTSRTTYPCVVFRYKDEIIAKFTALSGVLRLHLAKLDIESYNYNKFFQFSMGEKRPFELVPFTVRIKSNRALNNAKKLIEDLMKKLETEKKQNYRNVDYASNFGVQDFSLFKRLGMKEYILESAAANETDKFISTEKAEEIFNESKKIKDINISLLKPKQVTITTNLLEEKYRTTQAVTLTSLKRRGLIDKDVTEVKLTAEGQLTKQLDVRLQEISPTAIKMILAVGGNVVKQILK